MHVHSKYSSYRLMRYASVSQKLRRTIRTGVGKGLGWEQSTVTPIFTITATAADNVDQGFLSRVGSNVFGAVPCEIPLSGPFSIQEDGSVDAEHIYIESYGRAHDFIQFVTSSSLNCRGWVMQERTLSKRVLHFTVNGLFWDSSELTAHDQRGEVPCKDEVHDDCPFSIDPICRRQCSIPTDRWRSLWAQHGWARPIWLRQAWFSFVVEYSRTKFTDARDKVLVLSSVARAVQPHLESGDYYAGLWRNQLPEGCCGD